MLHVEAHGLALLLLELLGDPLGFGRLAADSRDHVARLAIEIVARIGVGSRRQQNAYNLSHVVVDGVVKRSHAVLVLDVESRVCAVLEQVLESLLAASLRHHVQDVLFVGVLEAHVGLPLDQQLDGRHVAARHGVEEGRALVVVSHVDLGAVVDQLLGDERVAALDHGAMEQRQAVLALAVAEVSLGGLAHVLDQGLEAISVASDDGRQELLLGVLDLELGHARRGGGGVARVTRDHWL